MTRVSAEIPARVMTVRGGEMVGADEVAAMVRLHGFGWGAKRLSKKFGCARNTVRRYLRAGGVVPFAKAPRKTAFGGLEDWLRRTVVPARRQCRCDPPGTGQRAWNCDWSALCGAEGSAVAARVEGATAGDDAL